MIFIVVILVVSLVFFLFSKRKAEKQGKKINIGMYSLNVILFILVFMAASTMSQCYFNPSKVDIVSKNVKMPTNTQNKLH